jgi:hypothetical protein
MKTFIGQSVSEGSHIGSSLDWRSDGNLTAPNEFNAVIRKLLHYSREWLSLGGHEPAEASAGQRVRAQLVCLLKPLS